MKTIDYNKRAGKMFLFHLNNNPEFTLHLRYNLNSLLSIFSSRDRIVNTCLREYDLQVEYQKKRLVYLKELMLKSKKRKGDIDE